GTRRQKICARCLSGLPDSRSIRIASRFLSRKGRSVTSGQSEHEVPDDVALNLRCACLDGVAARAQIAVRPDAFVDGVAVRGFELSVGTEQFLRDLLEPLVQLAPEDLLNRAFGPRDSGGADAAEGAH